MESLKALHQVCQKDPRQDAFVMMDANDPGVFRKRTLEDFHRAAESIRLHEGVPEQIRSHFETARNLIIYSWFYYPFSVTAQLSAYTSVEFALRTKTADRKTHFKTLLKKAVGQGWITDKGFSQPKRKLERIRRMNEGWPSELQTPEPPMVREYCDILVETIPFLRNSLAHGSSMLHEHGAFDVRICAEIINQLFPLPPDTTPTSPGQP